MFIHGLVEQSRHAGRTEAVKSFAPLPTYRGDSLPASKDRLLWSGVPASARADIEALVGGHVTQAQNCPGGFSPGFASRVHLSDGRCVFVKAMDADMWPEEAATHRTEALVAAALPPEVPAPQFLGSFDDGRWVVLAFEDIDGVEPPQPWDRATLECVVAAVVRMTEAMTPSPIALPQSHPRLGGWVDLARDQLGLGRLPEHSPWAADNLSSLVALEEEGLAAAQGISLVHFDLYPHNILMTSEQVAFIDWPHARLGAPIVDLVIVLTSAAADGINPEPLLRSRDAKMHSEPRAIDAILAANAGFLIAGGLSPTPPGLEAIAAAKLGLGLGAVDWLQRRLNAHGR